MIVQGRDGISQGREHDRGAPAPQENKGLLIWRRVLVYSETSSLFRSLSQGSVHTRDASTLESMQTNKTRGPGNSNRVVGLQDLLF